MWTELMEELDALTEPSGRNAHRAATIARTLLNDREWLDGVHHGVLDNAEKEVEARTKRMLLRLDDAINMIEFFPDIKDWDGADLDELRWKAAELRNQRRAKKQTPIGNGMSSNGRHPEPPVGEPEPNARKVITELSAEYDHKLKEKQAEIAAERARVAKQEKEMGRLNTKAAQFQSELHRLRAELKALRAENAELKKENAGLRQENERLKRKSKPAAKSAR